MIRNLLCSVKSHKTFLLKQLYNVRLQSTMASPTEQLNATSTVNLEVSDKTKSAKSMTDEMNLESNWIKTDEAVFKIFPDLRTIKPSELVGATDFGKNSYFVARSSKGNLPVYSNIKRGGKLVTEIRKIEGDIVQLRNDLQAALPEIPKSEWKIYIQSKKIIVQRDCVRDIKQAMSTVF
ncbi:HHL082Wp [Eremothecium sinecaudum]|uniref:Large ribosomal subunit protein mL49 n=1 Tax=Eremothecium sinecaudum TaxID=45286 RepID=A0A0X8HWG8_9SACH|nr:HHL082Wp [Eremothecium sinecaudum]AMD22688.1 HHL082Wp [Eremothecium sinecaudum]